MSQTTFKLYWRHWAITSKTCKIKGAKKAPANVRMNGYAGISVFAAACSLYIHDKTLEQ